MRHVGYLFVNAQGAVIYSPSNFSISGFTCAGKIYGDVNIQPTTDTYRQIENDGWIEWGGSQPVEDGVEVEFKMRNGKSDIASSSRLDWSHDGLGGDIIAYRVIEND